MDPAGRAARLDRAHPPAHRRLRRWAAHRGRGPHHGLQPREAPGPRAPARRGRSRSARHHPGGPRCHRRLGAAARRSRQRPPRHGADRLRPDPVHRGPRHQRTDAGASGQPWTPAPGRLDRNRGLRPDGPRLVGHRARRRARVRRFPAHERRAAARLRDERAGGPVRPSRACRPRGGPRAAHLVAGSQRDRRNLAAAAGGHRRPPHSRPAGDRRSERLVASERLLRRAASGRRCGAVGQQRAPVPGRAAHGARPATQRGGAPRGG